MLYNLTQEQLARVRLPLGGLHKTEVREIAEKRHFINARKHDSQDICFVPDRDYAKFMETSRASTTRTARSWMKQAMRWAPTTVRCGTPSAAQGLGLAMGAPVYVCAKDMQANTVTVGPEDACLTASSMRTRSTGSAFRG